MYPHERSLVQRLADKPFVLLGVNSDSDRKEIQQTIKTESLTWRSWWDDGRVEGPVQTLWQVTERPAIYLIDANGVIRYKNIDEADLDAAIDTLLAAEASTQ
jgi:hypothetical protein